jgi:hypothetical protein
MYRSDLRRTPGHTRSLTDRPLKWRAICGTDLSAAMWVIPTYAGFVLH